MVNGTTPTPPPAAAGRLSRCCAPRGAVRAIHETSPAMIAGDGATQIEKKVESDQNGGKPFFSNFLGLHFGITFWVFFFSCTCTYTLLA